ncbi:MAG TPA: hypothetical protein VH744_13585 [Terriglobales bacterium]
MKLRGLFSLALCVALAPMGVMPVQADSPTMVRVELVSDSMGPREMEDLTRKKIVRDYAAAWRTLAFALEQNRADVLNEYFTGYAKQDYVQAIASQKTHGVRRHYEDRGHRLEGLFYSPDGGVMQLRDTAQFEVQILDGDRLLYSQPMTVTYIVLMTPAADRWMVRLLQEAPSS